jgi:recombination protein RecA
LEVVQKSGSWYSYNEERIGQGRENAKQFLKENTAIRHEIESKIRESLGMASAAYTIAAHDEEDEEELKELSLLLDEE